MSQILFQVKCPYCEGTNVKKNGIKANGTQNFYCQLCHKQFQFAYLYKGADPRIKRQVRCMTFNGSGIRDIHRVLGVSIVGILMILRVWFKTLEEPLIEGHFKRVQIDEMWTFVKHRKQGKRWLWYAYDPDSGKILAFHIGKRNDSACKALMKKLSHLQIDSYRTDDWKSYRDTLSKSIFHRKNILLPKLKLLTLKDETEILERI